MLDFFTHSFNSLLFIDIFHYCIIDIFYGEQ